MPDYNQDIRRAIKQSRVRQYEVAKEIGIHPTTFCSWLTFGELSPERKEQIFKAIEQIKQ